MNRAFGFSLNCVSICFLRSASLTEFWFGRMREFSSEDTDTENLHQINNDEVHLYAKRVAIVCLGSRLGQ